MLWAPWSMSSKQMARSRSREMGLPKSWWLMASFWQKTHPREQPEKNTVPEPRVPEMGGSSHWWRAARATTGASGIRHTPRPSVSVRRAPHRRGQRLQIIGFLLLPRFAVRGRGQAPPLRFSAVSPFPPIQAGAAGALQRKPPPPERYR